MTIVNSAIGEVATSITVADVDASIARVIRSAESIWDEWAWQVENRTWELKGHASWDEMRRIEYGSLTNVTAPRAERPELVSRFRAAGLTQKETASTLGVTERTVQREDTIEGARGPSRNTTFVGFSGGGGDVIDAEIVEDVEPAAVVVPERAPTTGMDGKTNQRPAPKPVPHGDDVDRLNAETESKALGRALMTLTGMKYPEHRTRVINEWWPRGNDSVPPDSRALFEPKAIREIASWLVQLADDLEVAP